MTASAAAPTDVPTGAAASTPPKPVPWIIGRTADWLLFLGTPAVIVLVFLGLQTSFQSRTLQSAVMAFGALGHNLPGMLRAYGDRALFRRFRTRFLVAPIAFAGASVAFALSGSGGLLLIAYLWAIWHALMQMYGFLRIYDARIGSIHRGVARLDFAMCVAWFGGALAFSDARLFYIQSLAVEFGIAPLTPASWQVLRLAVATGIGLVTLAYLVDLVRRWRAGEAISACKHVLYVSSISFWWYVHTTIDDVLLGLVMFEVFHDVQYLAIVWVFNRRRADTDANAGSFTRFLFRRSGLMLSLYLGMCLLYGGLLPAAQSIETTVTQQLLLVTFVQTSALLHYYYDGFLWKVREASTQQALGLDARGRADGLVTWHGVKWLGLALPAAVLYLCATRPVTVADAQALARSTPHAAQAHLQLGLAYADADQPLAAVAAFDAALAITPGDELVAQRRDEARFRGGLSLLRQGRASEAGPLLQRALHNVPTLAEHATYVGEQLRQRGDREEAVVHFRAALLMVHDLAPAHLNLALALRDLGQREQALVHARSGAQLLPGDARAQALVQELEHR